MREDMLALLKTLCETAGPSGREERVSDLLGEKLAPYADRVYRDKLGNLIAVLNGGRERPRILLCAHLDEVGLVVRQIHTNGLISFDKIGWVDDRVLPAKLVDIVSEGGAVRGVIGVKSRHLLTQEEISRPLGYREMRIDVGARDDAATRALGVEIGQGISFATPFTKLPGGLVAAKALDNRIGCALLVGAFRELAAQRPDFTVVGAATVQEEIGSRGARTAAFQAEADLAIVLDTVPADDETNPDPTLGLGAGPCLRVRDHHEGTLLGTVGDPRLISRIAQAAQRAKIPLQSDIMSGTYTDASAIHTVGEGVPSAAILVPRRYAHSPCEVASLEDIENTGRLLLETLHSLREEDFHGRSHTYR